MYVARLDQFLLGSWLLRQCLPPIAWLMHQQHLAAEDGLRGKRGNMWAEGVIEAEEKIEP